MISTTLVGLGADAEGKDAEMRMRMNKMMTMMNMMNQDSDEEEEELSGLPLFSLALYSISLSRCKSSGARQTPRFAVS